MKALRYFAILILATACSSEPLRSNCDFLPNVMVNAVINLNLPQFDQLNFTSGVVKLPGQGNAGVFLIRQNAQTILAWDGADPSQPLGSCSAMTLNGTEVSSTCGEGNTYTLSTGSPLSGTTTCTLKPYRVLPIGDNVYQLTN